MQAKINPNFCIGCGLCVGMVPDVFRMSEGDKAESYQSVVAENENIVQEAIDSCPVSAIEWEE